MHGRPKELTQRAHAVCLVQDKVPWARACAEQRRPEAWGQPPGCGSFPPRGRLSYAWPTSILDDHHDGWIRLAPSRLLVKVWIGSGGTGMGCGDRNGNKCEKVIRNAPPTDTHITDIVAERGFCGPPAKYLDCRSRIVFLHKNYFYILHVLEENNHASGFNEKAYSLATLDTVLFFLVRLDRWHDFYLADKLRFMIGRCDQKGVDALKQRFSF